MTVLARLERSLADLGVGVVRVHRAGFAEALRERVIEPAVGAPLPFAGLSYEGTVVDPSPTADAVIGARTGVTHAAAAIAETGSIVLPTTPTGVEPISLFCERHVAVVQADDVLADVGEAIGWLGTHVGDARGSAVLATGPSATADMGELVRGAHGPREVEVIVLEDFDGA